MHARPVYPAGQSRTLNTFTGFRHAFKTRPEKTLLTITASTLYRVHLNGRFIAHGPARCAHNHYRLDTLDLTPHLHADSLNVLVIEVAGYNANSYYLLDQPAFLLAQLTGNDQILAATGDPVRPFVAFNLPHRLQKVQRFSFQRPFVEMYRLQRDALRYLTDPAAPIDEVPLDILPDVLTLPRNLPYPAYATRQPTRHLAAGALKPAPKSKKIHKDRSVTAISPTLKGYPEAEVPLVLSTLLQSYDVARHTPVNTPYDSAVPLKLTPRTFHLLDMGGNPAGFLGVTIRCTKPATIIAEWDELLDSKGRFIHRCIDCADAMSFDLQPGTYTIESMDPYSFRYLRFFATRGAAEISNVYLREYTHPDAFRAHFACSDDALNTIFAAARETFRNNAVDIFMDCPSRERAGWLCDSYFTAEAEFTFTGRSAVERAFLENFLLPDHFPHLPPGMLPMCYPADHYNGVHIPQWSLWFVLELETHLARAGDRWLIDALRPRVETLFAEYFAKYLNPDGLLENLQGWRFIEWSKANELQDGVNYPTNMLYAAALDAAARLYQIPAYAAQAKRIRRKILEQSFDGQFFVDNAIRKDGTLVPTGERTEVCQYFAFTFGLASAQSHPALWKKLLSRFGPARRPNAFGVHPANLLVGNILRLSLLSGAGKSAQLLDDIRALFLPMATATGTLWEHNTALASCNHGFASFAACLLISDALGLSLDRATRTAHFAIPKNDLEWCHANLPVGPDFIHIQWSRKSKTPPEIVLPSGWTLRE